MTPHVQLAAAVLNCRRGNNGDTAENKADKKSSLNFNVVSYFLAYLDK